MNYNTFLPPFKWFVLENFPYIENDFDALTNWQLFCKLGKEMNKIIEKCNLTGEQVENLTNAFNTLKAYVDNYFENLDIQEEVDTKLDEMAQSGELAELISQYLESQAIIGFNTCSSLASAINLANGSFARTLGRNTYADGYGAFYKIRTRTNADNPDGYNLITLTETENLVAERIVSQTEKDVEQLNNDMSLIKNKKFLFVGDSYARGYQGEGQEYIEGYFNKVVNALDLDAQIVCANGYGFMGLNNNLLWKDLLINTTINNKESFTDIIVCGGMNDRNTDANFKIYMDEFFDYVETNFPNAEIHVGCVGRYKSSTESNLDAMRKVSRLYRINTVQRGHKYIEGSELILHNMNWFISDNVHPNTDGEKQLAYGIEQYIENGNINDVMVVSNSGVFQQDTIEPSSGISLSNFSCYSYINKDITTWLFTGQINFVSNVSLSNLTTITIGQLTNSYVCSSNYNQGLNEVVDGYVYSTTQINGSNFVKVKFRLFNDNNNNIKLTSFSVMDNGNLLNLTINQIAFPYGAIKCEINSHFC